MGLTFTRFSFENTNTNQSTYVSVVQYLVAGCCRNERLGHRLPKVHILHDKAHSIIILYTNMEMQL